MDKIDTKTPDVTEENIEKLIELFPQVATEVENAEGEVERAIDFDALRDLLGDVAEGQRERYQFTWPGKREAKAEARRPIDKTMIPCPEKSVDWDSTENLYIEGDNLDALKLLKETYAGKIRMIFIDPPYNTGSDSFLYPDSYVLSQDSYDQDNGEISDTGMRLVENKESFGRFHSVWNSMIYQRLILARELLAPDGSIFICIDHVEFGNLKEICDEIFGQSCFKAHIAWRHSDNSNNNALTFSEDFNDILCYSRQPDWKPNFLDDPEKRKHFKNPDNDPRGPWFDGNPVNNPGLRPNLQFDITTPSGKTIKHPPNGWRWSRERMEEKFSTGELRFSEDETRVIRRTYLADMEGLPPSTLWSDLEKTGHTRSAKYALKSLFPEMPVTDLFSTPKPIQLIMYILDLATKTPDDYVMDFFAGSGSSAEAVMTRNSITGSKLKSISVQIPEPLSNNAFSNLFDMSIERVKRAGERLLKKDEQDENQTILLEDGFNNLDVGFRVLKIDSSNFKDNYLTPNQAEQTSLLDTIDNVKEGRTSEDILFQVLPAFRIPYSAHIEEQDINGKKVFDVNYGQLLACFDIDVTNDVIEEIARRKPSYAVMRDLSFKDDSAAANFEELFKTFSPDTIRRVI